MKKKQKDSDLFFTTIVVLFVEIFLFLDRWTGGGLLTFLVAVIVPVVFMVLVAQIYPTLKNEKLKKGLKFVFAGFVLLSAYIMWGIIGGFLGIILGIMLAGIIFAGTMAMVSKPKAGRSNSATRKNANCPG